MAWCEYYIRVDEYVEHREDSNGEQYFKANIDGLKIEDLKVMLDMALGENKETE